MARKKPSNTQQQSLFTEPEAPAIPENVSPLHSVEMSLPEHFPESWVPYLGKEFAEPYLADLVQFVDTERQQEEIFPAADEVFNAYRFCSPDQVRVVILGQDPYPTPGHAHGLCFSVRHGVAIPASLRNIYQELQTDLGFEPAKHGNLESWARQGVFLLNTVLTVRSGKPASHANRGWETFTDATLRIINERREQVVFLLWGAYAQKKTKLIDSTRHKVIASPHPSPLSACTGFFGSKPFSRTNAALEEKGLPPINWQLPAALS
jgi:uracil-DNA glycosylase